MSFLDWFRRKRDADDASKSGAMDRRAFFAALGVAGMAVAAPTRVYSFLWNNPIGVGVTAESFAEILKRIYTPEMMRELTYERAGILRLFKTGDMFGVERTLSTTREHGIHLVGARDW